MNEERFVWHKSDFLIAATGYFRYCYDEGILILCLLLYPNYWLKYNFIFEIGTVFYLIYIKQMLLL